MLRRQTPRFDKECLETMVKYCPNLKELKMREFGLLADDWLPEIAKLKQLELLDLSAPGTSSLTDEPVIALLKEIGAELDVLNLEDHIRLTDRVLLEGIVPHCLQVRRLILANVADYTPPQEDEQYEKSGLTNDGVAKFFTEWKASGHEGLFEANFSMCHDLKEEALNAMISHSGATIENLNVKGWKTVSEDSLTEIGRKCPNLKDLNVGWCRLLTDFSMKEILEGCDKLERVKAWGQLSRQQAWFRKLFTDDAVTFLSGCNKLTDNVPRKKGCKVTGIEAHAIGL